MECVWIDEASKITESDWGVMELKQGFVKDMSNTSKNLEMVIYGGRFHSKTIVPYEVQDDLNLWFEAERVVKGFSGMCRD